MLLGLSHVSEAQPARHPDSDTHRTARTAQDTLHYLKLPVLEGVPPGRPFDVPVMGTLIDGRAFQVFIPANPDTFIVPDPPEVSFSTSLPSGSHSENAHDGVVRILHTMGGDSVTLYDHVLITMEVTIRREITEGTIVPLRFASRSMVNEDPTRLIDGHIVVGPTPIDTLSLPMLSDVAPGSDVTVPVEALLDTTDHATLAFLFDSTILEPAEQPIGHIVDGASVDSWAITGDTLRAEISFAQPGPLWGETLVEFDFHVRRTYEAGNATVPLTWLPDPETRVADHEVHLADGQVTTTALSEYLELPDLTGVAPGDTVELDIVGYVDSAQAVDLGFSFNAEILKPVSDPLVRHLFEDVGSQPPQVHVDEGSISIVLAGNQPVTVFDDTVVVLSFRILNPQRRPVSGTLEWRGFPTTNIMERPADLIDGSVSTDQPVEYMKLPSLSGIAPDSVLLVDIIGSLLGVDRVIADFHFDPLVMEPDSEFVKDHLFTSVGADTPVVTVMSGRVVVELSGDQAVDVTDSLVLRLGFHARTFLREPSTSALTWTPFPGSNAMDAEIVLVNGSIATDQPAEFMVLPTISEIAPGDTFLVAATGHLIETDNVDLAISYDGEMIQPNSDLVGYHMFEPSQTATVSAVSQPNQVLVSIGSDEQATVESDTIVTLYFRALTGMQLSVSSHLSWISSTTRVMGAPVELVDGLVNVQVDTLYGDVSNNGGVSPLDALMVLQHVASGDPPVNGVIADVTGNGFISSLDALWILRRSVDAEILFPVETGGDSLVQRIAVELPRVLSWLQIGNSWFLTVDDASELFSGLVSLELATDDSVVVRGSTDFLAVKQDGRTLTVGFVYWPTPSTVLFEIVPPIQWSEPPTIVSATAHEGQIPLTFGPTAIADAEVSRLEISSIAPNPFNGTVSVRYTAREPGVVDLEVYNIAGQRVAVLAHHRAEPGTAYRAIWNGLDQERRHASNGVYLIRLESRNALHIRKVTLVR